MVMFMQFDMFTSEDTWYGTGHDDLLVTGLGFGLDVITGCICFVVKKEVTKLRITVKPINNNITHDTDIWLSERILYIMVSM